MNAQIASHLNVAESAILRVEEWAHVLFAVVKGLGARFVSKKVVEVKVVSVPSVSAEELVAVGGSHWQKHGKDRVYFEIQSILPDLSNSKKRQLGGVKLFFDLDDQKWFNSATTCGSEVNRAIARLQDQLDMRSSSSHEASGSCCYSCNASGIRLLGGSLGLLCPDCYDDVEGGL